MSARDIYSFIPRPYPTPGTGNYAFVQNTTLPTSDVRGAGRRVFNQFSAFAAQVFNLPTVKPEGFGGLFSGQLTIQPLLEPKRNGIS